MKNSIPAGIRHVVILLMASVLAFGTLSITAFAAAAKTEVAGRIYDLERTAIMSSLRPMSSPKLGMTIHTEFFQSAERSLM